MKTFKDYIINPIPLEEHLSDQSKLQAELLVDELYSNYIKEYSKHEPECVGWLDGSKNALIRNTKLYEAGIQNNDSVLDVGCGVAHFYYFLKNQGWNGKYFGVDPNQEAINIIDEKINTKCGTIDDLDNSKYDWVIASGIFNIGLSESITLWTIHNMIPKAKKGMIFYMLKYPYKHKQYESYEPGDIMKRLNLYEHERIEVIEDYMEGDPEFTVYFYV